MNEDPTRKLPPSSFEERIMARLDSIEASFNARLNAVEANLNAQIAEVREQLTDVRSRLTTLEDKVERRLMETRPIWEAMQAQLTDVQTKVNDTQGQLKHLNAKLGIFLKEFYDLRAEQELLSERFEQLEKSPS